MFPLKEKQIIYEYLKKIAAFIVCIGVRLNNEPNIFLENRDLILDKLLFFFFFAIFTNNLNCCILQFRELDFFNL